MMNKKCPYCQKILAQAEAQCPKCIRPLTEKKSSKASLVIVIVVIAFIVGMISFSDRIIKKREDSPVAAIPIVLQNANL